jgi:hypothetical protein
MVSCSAYPLRRTCSNFQKISKNTLEPFEKFLISDGKKGDEDGAA